MNNPQPPQSILAVRLSALGDVILSIPTLRRLQRSFPNTKISWMTSPIFKPLFPQLNNIEWLTVNKPRRLKDYLSIYRTLHHRSFDCLLAFQSSLRSHLIYPMVKAPLKIGFSKQQAKDFHWLFVNQHLPFKKEHLLDSAWRFADALQAQDQTMDWGFSFTPEEIQWANERLSPDQLWIAINPAASSAERSCSAKFYINLIRNLQAAFPVKFVLTGGTSAFEMELAQTITQACPTNLVNYVGKTSLRELATLLNQCDLMISPDTGPLHLADALGKPVIGLYAVAPPELCGPYHYRHWVINCYPDAVRQFLGKEPEQVPWVTRVHHPNVMSLIKSTPIMEKVSDWFQQIR